MKKSMVAAFAAALVFTACGGGGSDQDELALRLLAEAKDSGLNADEACVKDVAAKLSDEDAKKILALPEDADIDAAGLSEEGFSIAVGVLNCVDPAQFIEDAITQLKDSGVPVDEQCVRDSFKGVDFSEFTADGDIPAGLQDALFNCVDIGALGS